MKKLIILLLLLPSLAWGACGGSSPNLIAASANRSDVLDCVTAATYGDTISIPAGTGTGWTSGITITKDLKIQGAGVSNTFIDYDITDTETGVFIFSPDAQAETNIETLESSGLFEITGITFTNLTDIVDGVGVNVEILKIIGADVSKVIKKIRIHHNRFMCAHHVLGSEVGPSHGVIDNNYLFFTSLAYTGASDYYTTNVIHPGSGGGWYFEDNVLEVASANLRRGTDNKTIKTSAFKYWLGHTFYDKVAVDGTSLPEGTIANTKYGIFRVAIGTDGEIDIIAGVDNATGYADPTAAIAAIPAVPADHANMGGFYVYNNSGDTFTNGTTALNATGVTTTYANYPNQNGYVVGGNNRGAGHIVRYNKYTGEVDKNSSSFTGKTLAFFDDHSNQSAGIKGGQILEIYGNNLVAQHYDGSINTIVEGGVRGQKNIVLYNRFTDYSGASFFVREEFNDYFSIDTTPEFDASEKAELDALYMCTARTTYNGPKQVCPGYYIALPDRIATRCGCWKVHDSYFFNNWRGTTAVVATGPAEGLDNFTSLGDVTANDPPEVVENVEFFNYVALGSFDGSVGVTCGTYEQMQAITATTIGVGFWVPTDISTMPCTSLSSDNIKQTEGVNVTTPITGTLYKWDGDSWEAFWVPYTYPHPLRGTGKASVSIGSGSVMSIGSGATATLY